MTKLSEVSEIEEVTNTTEISEQQTAAEESAVSQTEQAQTDEAPAGRLSFRERRKRKRERMFNVTTANDIRYKPPLSYRHFKLIAWLLLVLTQLQLVMEKFYSDGTSSVGHKAVSFVVGTFAGFAVPLLLISCLAIIMNGHDNYKLMLVKNAGLAVLLFLLTLFVYERYLMRIASSLMGGDREAGAMFLQKFVSQKTDHGFLAFNIFIDLLLCTLTMFFINYTPQKIFTGRKVIIFRSFIIFPIAYEVGSIIVKILATEDEIRLPIYLFPLLTTKPPVCFLMFISIACFFKRRERRFIKYGKTQEEYQEYLKTNYNAMQVSKMFIKRIIVFAVLDLVLLVFIASVEMVMNNISDASEEATFLSLDRAWSWGIGNTAELVLIIPLLLLFSYTKKHKSIIIDIIIPLAGVVLIVFIYFDGAFQAACDVIMNNYYGE